MPPTLARRPKPAGVFVKNTDCPTDSLRRGLVISLRQALQGLWGRYGKPSSHPLVISSTGSSLFGGNRWSPGTRLWGQAAHRNAELSLKQVRCRRNLLSINP